jgi:D-alanyl-D-alanine carboxypeptidase (penicillin-binding protein 5/6)
MEELTIEDLLFGLMLPSGNDAARAIARSIAGDDYRFAQLMNNKALELGLVNTHYVNPHGRNQEGHYTSACDLARLGRYAMQNPSFRQIVGTKRVSIQGRFGGYPMQNINRFLLDYRGANGIKTGYDDERIPTTGQSAGSAVIASAERDGRTGYVAVLHTWANYATEAANLMDYFFNNYAALVP